MTGLAVGVLIGITMVAIFMLRSPKPTSEHNRCFKLYHTTDVHGWIDGHPHLNGLNATFGVLESFFSHASAQSRRSGCDFLLFNTGDLVEGTGISDATPVHGQHVYTGA